MIKNEALTGLKAGVSREITPEHNPPSHAALRRGSCRFHPRAKSSGFSATANKYVIPVLISIANNSTDSIQIDLRQNSKSLLGQLRTIPANTEFPVYIDVSNQKTILHIFFCPTTIDCTNMQKKLNVTFPADKTIYIKFDGKKIEAQQGTSGLTKLGFSMAHNISNDDFTSIESNVNKQRITVLSTKPTLAHSTSSPARPKKPAPTMQSTKQKEKPQKPDASTKPYHDLAWAQFPQANGIRHSGSSLMHSYYNKNSDPRVTQMAQAVLQVPENAGEKAIGTAYENAISTFSTPEFTNSPALHKEIMKIIDTAYAILTQ